MFGWFQRLLPHSGDFYVLFERHAAAMIGALTDVRRPERGAVAAAGEAVAAYVEAANTAGSATTRRAAAIIASSPASGRP